MNLPGDVWFHQWVYPTVSVIHPVLELYYKTLHPLLSHQRIDSRTRSCILHHSVDACIKVCNYINILHEVFCNCISTGLSTKNKTSETTICFFIFMISCLYKLLSFFAKSLNKPFKYYMQGRRLGIVIF